MKKYGYILCILLFMSCPNFVNAACSNADKVKYQELAKNINVSYDYVEANANAIFSIKFSNIQPYMKIRDVIHDTYYYYNSSELILNNFFQGKSYRFDVYSDFCGNDVIYSHYVTLPYYNAYYNSPLCKGIEEFKYCQKWTKRITSGTEFQKEVEKYRSEKYAESLNEEPKKETIFEIVWNIYLKYYYIILPLIIITLSIIIYRKNKKEDLF